MDRKAKIVATLGPSSMSEAVISRLIQAGIDVVRLNFSHGTHEDHAARIDLVRRLSEKFRKPITILQDLQGPKLRVGNLPPDGIKLHGNDVVLLSEKEQSKIKSQSAHTTFIPMDVPNLSKSLTIGDRILLDDGHMELETIAVGTDYIQATVITGGILTSHKGVNLPGAHLEIPGFTEKDRADLEFGLSHDIDAVAISFVCSANDVNIVRQAIREFAPKKADLPIIAKLERPEAMKNLQEIILAADGVMVARGDLAVETSPASVPIMQKIIIQAANQYQKIVITATQMLESMINDPRPTRAEASDVANAIFDSTDAVMLSGETAMGKYPVEAVSMMDSIIREAELHFTEWGQCLAYPEQPTQDDAISITRAARELAHDRNVAAIAVFTQTGKTALLMSKTRPRVPIIAFTPEINTLRRLSMMWGVIPFLVPEATTFENMVSIVDTAMMSNSQLNAGQQVIIISGFPVAAWRQANFALLHTIGEVIR